MFEMFVVEKFMHLRLFGVTLLGQMDSVNNVVAYECDCLWSPYVIGQTIIFLPCGFFFFFILSSFFPRLISAVADWMSVILPHMVWP